MFALSSLTSSHDRTRVLNGITAEAGRYERLADRQTTEDGREDMMGEAGFWRITAAKLNGGGDVADSVAREIAGLLDNQGNSMLAHKVFTLVENKS